MDLRLQGKAAIVSGGSIGIAVVSYHFIELPSIEWGKRVADKLKARPAVERSEPAAG